MNVPSLMRYAVSLSAAVTLVAGCGGGGSQPSIAVGSAMTRGDALFAMTNARGYVPTHRINRGKSWADPAAKHTQYLLYASDFMGGVVDVYAYRSSKGKLLGQATAMDEPYGQCADSSGNVYVVNFGNSVIDEFAHGGTTPIATATDSHGIPIGCAIDRTTGNLAVANLTGTSGAGGIDVFAGGIAGTQSYFTDAGGLYYMWPPAYDLKGNLYVEGRSKSGYVYGIDELPAGATTFTHLSGLTIGMAAGVSWDGSYIAAADQNYMFGGTTAFNEIRISGSAITILATWNYTDNCDGNATSNDVIAPFIHGRIKHGKSTSQPTVVGSNLYCISRLGFWQYTANGLPRRLYSRALVPKVGLYGQSVSVTKR